MGELVHANAVIEIRRVLETDGSDPDEETGAVNLQAVRGSEGRMVLGSSYLQPLQCFAL